MKLKFINCLLAVAILGGAAQVLTSCKDNNEDMFAELKDNDRVLQNNIDALQTALNDLRAATDAKFEECKAACAAALAAHEAQNQQEFASINAQLSTLASQYATLSSQLGALENAVNGHFATVDAQILALQDALAALANSTEAKFADLQAKFNDLEPRVAANEAAIVAANAKIAANEAAINNINTLISTIQADLGNLANEVTIQGQSIAQLQNDLAALQADLTSVKNDLAALQGDVAANAAAISTLTAEVNRIDSEVSNLLGIVAQLQNRISSIVLQGTWNPIFGQLNLPVGVQSNVLLAYSGSNQYPTVKFPSVSMVNTYNGEEPCITNADLALLTSQGLQQVTFQEGEMLMNTENNYGDLGKIYFTVNPSNIDLTGKTFTLQNSRGQNSVVELQNVQPSDELLEFGYSRNAANGFYEADAKIFGNSTSLSQARFQGAGNFRDNVVETIKNFRDTKDFGNLAALGNLVYNQFNGFLPALGVAATWTEDGTAHTVLSNYGVAAAVFQPLSYRFANGTSLRTIPALPDLNNFEFNLATGSTDVAFDETFDLVGGGIDIHAPLHIVLSIYMDKLGCEIQGYPVLDGDGNQIGTTNLSFEVATMSQLSAGFKAALVAQIPSDATASVRTELLNAIDNLMVDVDASIDDNTNIVSVVQGLEETMQDVQDQVNGKIEKITNKISRFYDYAKTILNRVNKVLADPNHYLQPSLWVKSGNSVFHMSNTLAAPSTFKIEGGNSVLLVPTTYTGEIVTPAYRKVVAVTNVYKTDDLRFNAQATGSFFSQKCMDLVQAANSQQYMNTVFNGERRTLAFSFEGAQGYTYEILYSAIDYQGCASSQKYYVSVK